MTSRDYWGLALGGASMLPMLFAGDGDSTDDPLKALRSSADRAAGMSKEFSAQGADLMGPATDYLKKLISGDRSDLMQATMPERRRVIDQYSSAKRAIAEFTPRGGGQASAMMGLQAQQAGDLAGLGAGARKDATSAALGAGTQLKGMGLSAESLASNDLSALIQAITQKNQGNQSNWAAVGSAVGTMLPLLLAL